MSRSHWDALVATWHTFNDTKKKVVIERAEKLAMKMGRPEWLQRMFDNVFLTSPPSSSHKPAAREVVI